MSLVLEIVPYKLDFSFGAGTSRGVLHERNTWFLIIKDEQVPKVVGIGEAAPLKGLSIDDVSHFPIKLREIQSIINGMSMLKSAVAINELIANLGLEDYPSIAFALETALLDLINGGKRVVYENDFSRGLHRIPINGLIWMGDKDFMLAQVNDKLGKGYNCLKMKVGALSFETECEVLGHIRSKATVDKLTLRVDANGAFTSEDVEDKLDRLSQYGLHSIEQPIGVGQIDLLKALCKTTKVPIALDEELIGKVTIDEKHDLLRTIKPQYIILKPTLVGGFQSCKEWINVAESFGIGWWITSALESNVGLNAISQFTYSRRITSHQGLGTGQLFTNNIPSPLKIENGYIVNQPNLGWDLSAIL